MIKFKYIFILVVIFSFLTTEAQDFKILSLGGYTEKISLSHEIGDQKLIMSYKTDKVVVDDFIGFNQDPVVLNSCFLAIRYIIKTGSDQLRERTLLLCVNENKLSIAAHIGVLSQYALERVFNKKADSLKLFDEHGSYELKMSIGGNNSTDYKMYVNIHDESVSKRKPATNHAYDKHIVLDFDKEQAVFYNTYEDISQYFMIHEANNPKPVRQYLIGKYPTIKLDKLEYYFIRGKWYEKGNGDNLLAYSY